VGLKRFHVTGHIAGRAFPRRIRSWQVIAGSIAAAFAIGFGVVAAAAEVQQAGGASRAPAAVSPGPQAPAVKPYLTPPLLKAVPVGPGKVSKPVQTVLTSTELTITLDDSGIPVVALEAYQHAATTLAISDPACHLPWQLLAAIGRVESDDGRFGGAMLLPDGDTTEPIYGITLDGRDGIPLILNTDESEVELDGGSIFARAVGPMQFLPATWELYGADANDNGKKDPNNIFDAALAAGDYLCAGGGTMTNPAQEAAAVLSYNDADDYVRVVLALAASYEQGDYAAVPTPAPAGTGSNGGEPAPGSPSTPRAQAPAPAKTPVHTPAPQPAAPSIPATASPTPSPTAGPSPSPTTTAPATPAPAGTTGTGRTPPGQPSRARIPSAGRTVDLGWAPAMRQVVVKLLTAPKVVPAQPVPPTPPTPQPTESSTPPVRARVQARVRLSAPGQARGSHLG
jgi:membrane-bound lytic murein transglycosylase B